MEIYTYRRRENEIRSIDKFFPLKKKIILNEFLEQIEQ